MGSDPFIRGPYSRRVRKRLGFSQAKFAERIDVSLDTIRNWEQGKRRPTGAAKALLKVLDKAPEAALAALHWFGQYERKRGQAWLDNWVFDCIRNLLALWLNNTFTLQAPNCQARPYCSIIHPPSTQLSSQTLLLYYLLLLPFKKLLEAPLVSKRRWLYVWIWHPDRQETFYL